MSEETTKTEDSFPSTTEQALVAAGIPKMFAEALAEVADLDDADLTAAGASLDALEPPVNGLSVAYDWGTPPAKHDHPAHYGGKNNPYEAIKVIEAWGLDFCLGNLVKYVSRAGKKDGETKLDDLRKARWYLDRAISNLETKKEPSAP